MRGEDVGDDWSESDVEFSPYARQLTITKAKKLIRRHTKKYQSKKGLQVSLLFNFLHLSFHCYQTKKLDCNWMDFVIMAIIWAHILICRVTSSTQKLSFEHP